MTLIALFHGLRKLLGGHTHLRNLRRPLAAKHGPSRCSLHVEPLEPRWVPATGVFQPSAFLAVGQPTANPASLLTQVHVTLKGAATLTVGGQVKQMDLPVLDKNVDFPFPNSSTLALVIKGQTIQLGGSTETINFTLVARFGITEVTDPNTNQPVDLPTLNVKGNSTVTIDGGVATGILDLDGLVTLQEPGATTVSNLTLKDNASLQLQSGDSTTSLTDSDAATYTVTTATSGRFRTIGHFHTSSDSKLGQGAQLVRVAHTNTATFGNGSLATAQAAGQDNLSIVNGGPGTPQYQDTLALTMAKFVNHVRVSNTDKTWIDGTTSSKKSYSENLSDVEDLTLTDDNGVNTLQGVYTVR